MKGTVDYGLRYTRDHDFRLYGYADSDWEGSVLDMKRNSGGCFSLGSAMISWLSRKQPSVALSIAEVEYIVAFASEAISL